MATAANPIDIGALNVPDHQLTPYQPAAAFQLDTLEIRLPSASHVGDATAAPIPKINGWAAKEDWAKHQALIKQLYFHEKKPLAEVMRLMENRHGFKATLVLRATHFFFRAPLTFGRVKMYKTHIKQWGLDKKNKGPEMRAIVRKNQQRATQGKRSIIRVRGQLRDFAEIVRYLNRKGISIDDIIARRTASPTPEAVELFTPVPSPIRTPQELAIPERIFRTTRDYIKGSFESATWVWTESDSLCYSIKDREGAIGLMTDLHHHCINVCELFSRNLSHEAGRTLIIATAKIERILLQEDPHALSGLFWMIYDIRRNNRDRMASIILRQFSALGKKLLGSEHPFARVLEWTDSRFGSDFEDITIRCMEIIVALFESRVGPMHLSTVFSRESLISTIHALDTRIPMLQNWLGECEKTLQPNDVRVSHIRRRLAEAYFGKGCYAEAETLMQQDIAWTQSLSFNTVTSIQQSGALYIVAWCQYGRGDVDLGIATLYQATDISTSIWGPQDGRVRQYVLYLESWYLERGDLVYAAYMREWRQNILKSIDTD